MFKLIKNKRFRFIFIFVLLILVGVFIYLISFINKPYSVPVKFNNLSNASLSPSINLTPILLRGHLVTFKYPKSLELRSTSLVNVNSLEDYTFYFKDTYSWTLAIDIFKDNYLDSTSYVIRANNPTKYSASSEQLNGLDYKIFTDNTFNGFSKVAFISGSGVSATISLEGNDIYMPENLTKTFNIVLSNWQWN